MLCDERLLSSRLSGPNRVHRLGVAVPASRFSLFSHYGMGSEREGWDPPSVAFECPSSRRRISMTARESTQRSGDARALAAELGRDRFARETLTQQCSELGVPEHELVRFALLYYLADLDSGRIARRIPSASVAEDPR